VNCPACDRPLVVVETEGIEIDWCTACNGLWFDAGELDLLAEALGLVHAPGSLFQSAPGTGQAGSRSGGPRRCPRCRARMAMRVLDHRRDAVEVDVCPREHGIWFDAGELARVLTVLAQDEFSTGPAGTSHGGQPTLPASKLAGFLGQAFASWGKGPRARDPRTREV